MRGKAFLSAVVIALLSATPARAYVPERTPQRDIEARARASLDQQVVRGTTAALIVARGARTLVDVAGDRPMVPASLMKLLTISTAVLKFGPDHRFTTRVVASGSGTTVGALALVGGGDPTLATEAFRRRRYLPKPTDEIKEPAYPNGSPTIDQLAQRVAAAGINVVQGNLIADESLFDGQRRLPGWPDRYLTSDPETGLLSALTVNEGMLDLESERIAPNPALNAGELFKRALASRGVVVTGRVVVARAPAGAREIASVRSPTLSDIARFTLRYSINFNTEILLKGLGARFGGDGSTPAGAAVVRETMRSLGVPVDGLTMADGSGLSLNDRATPRTVGALLEHILTETGEPWDAIRAAMPVAGEPGTLQKRMRRAPVAGNLRGKTGSLARVRAMAGWVTPADGVPLVYVAVFNDVARPSMLTGVLDLLGTLLARAG